MRGDPARRALGLCKRRSVACYRVQSGNGIDHPAVLVCIEMFVDAGNSTNGPEAGSCNNPLRQGLSADLADGFRPNNVLGGIPTIALDYSPAWDANLYEWTQDAINNGYRGQLREEFQILTFVQDGLLTGPGGAAFGSAGFSINCPIVQRLD